MSDTPECGRWAKDHPVFAVFAGERSVGLELRGTNTEIVLALDRIAADLARPPPGYALVLIEPTKQMLTDVGTISGYESGLSTADDDHISWWKAMLNAAPQPQKDAT